MKNLIPFSFHARRVIASLAIAFAALIISSPSTTAGTWSGIEPLKSRRADVERLLGKPLKDQPGSNGTLHFKVGGGMVTVAFIDARFVATKKLLPEVEGTVRQVVLQHENATDTPESMGLANKSDFERQDGQGGTVYRNLKEGIVYTFLGGKLKTTYYTPTSEQWARAQRGS
ncbi:MAG TPA: hypothetical protein VGX92_01495 [Pyrinomonadaceae bacterium]|jgi:hypothetical protein|nr:hypothetical protein [Pyrinomonadaceae bacterium]